MAMTPLPDPPSRQDPDTFAAKSDALLGALPAFVTEANALQVDVTTKQGTASTAATTATDKAAEALTHANTASGHKDAAAISAGQAATSAGTAAARLADMEALYDQFDDRYLGVKASDPTVDNDGNALQAGAFYISSATGFIRAYNGTAWVQGISSISGVSSVNGQTGVVVLSLSPDPADSLFFSIIFS